MMNESNTNTSMRATGGVILYSIITLCTGCRLSPTLHRRIGLSSVSVPSTRVPLLHDRMLLFYLPFSVIPSPRILCCSHSSSFRGPPANQRHRNIFQLTLQISAGFVSSSVFKALKTSSESSLCLRLLIYNSSTVRRENR